MQEGTDHEPEPSQWAWGRGRLPLPHRDRGSRHALLRAAHGIPLLHPDGVVGAGIAATVAALLQRRLPERDVLQKRVVAAVVVAIGGCADVLPQEVAGLAVARGRPVERGHLVLDSWRLGPFHSAV